MSFDLQHTNFTFPDEHSRAWVESPALFLYAMGKDPEMEFRPLVLVKIILRLL